MNCDCRVEPIEGAEYRGHEIVISYCNKCKNFIVDARSDNFDGEFLSGYIDKSIYTAIEKAKNDIDRHCFNLSLTVNVPF